MNKIRLNVMRALGFGLALAVSIAVPAQATAASVAKKASSSSAASKAASKSSKSSASSRKVVVSKARATRPTHSVVAARKTIASVSSPVRSFGQLAGLHETEDPLALKSGVAFVVDQDTHQADDSNGGDRGQAANG
jgi:D-alanyl-D-alanine endopeptidase (penicillin-binding protein 7)